MALLCNHKYNGAQILGPWSTFINKKSNQFNFEKTQNVFEEGIRTPLFSSATLKLHSQNGVLMLLRRNRENLFSWNFFWMFSHMFWKIKNIYDLNWGPISSFELQFFQINRTMKDDNCPNMCTIIFLLTINLLSFVKFF